MSVVISLNGTAGPFWKPSPLPKVPTLTVPVPDDGWLTLTSPRDPSNRIDLAEAWRKMAAISAAAAGLKRMPRAELVAVARPREMARRGWFGIHAAEDVRPSLTCVISGLVDADVLIHPNAADGRELRMGKPTGPAGGMGYLQVWLTEVSRG